MSQIKSAQNLLKFATFDISNLQISILKSKKYFMNYLLPVRPKLIQKLKMLWVYWNSAHFMFWIPVLHFDVKSYFYWILATSFAGICPKIKSARNLLKFGTFDISNMPISMMLNIIFIIYYILYICLAQIGPKIKEAQDLLKSLTFDVLNILISILKSKMIFVKYLPPFRLKLVLILKMLSIYWNLAHSIF